MPCNNAGTLLYLFSSPQTHPQVEISFFGLWIDLAHLIPYVLERNAGWLDLHVCNSSSIVVAAV